MNNVHRRTVYPAAGVRRTPRTAARRYARQRIAARGRCDGNGYLLLKQAFLHWYEGKQAGGRGMPSPFIKIYERGRHTPSPGLRPSISAELLICRTGRCRRRVHGTLLAC